MKTYVRYLRQLVRESRYSVAEIAVAEAILKRSGTLWAVEPAGLALGGADPQTKESLGYSGGSVGGAPIRSVRRATSRRASKRRATARSRQRDEEAMIIDFLAKHPESTAGDVAKGLGLHPAGVSTRLSRLAKTDQIKRASHGYSTNGALPFGA